MEETFLGALHADPWVLSLIDLSELNEAASGLIESGVARIRQVTGQSPTQLRSESLVLLGPPGTGKTHLFARVRKNLGPRAAFVHIRPLLHAGLTPGYVLGQAVQQLAQPSFGRQELQADMLVGSMIGYLEDQSADYPAMNLSTFKDLPEKERVKRLEQLSDRLFDVFADLDDVFVERLLALPFAAPRNRRALLAWLSGQDCDPSQLGRIGAATSMDPSNAVRALRTLASVAALGSPLVLVFDQLENLIQRDGSEERVTQYGNLVAELIDSTRGLLVVQLALDSEWEQAITPQLNMSQRSRLVMTKAALTLPTPKQSRGLLELWCGKLDAPEQPFPWPLSAHQVERLCALPGVTPRMLLSALKEAREGSEPSILQTGSWRPEQGAMEPANGAGPSSSKAATSTAEGDADSELNALLAEEWLNQLAGAHQQLDQADARGAGVDDGRLRDAILLASTFASELSLRGVTDPYIQLESKVAGGKWVCLLHQAHFRSLSTALDRVLGRGPQAPGLVVREQWRAFPPTWKSVAERQARVLTCSHLFWHELSREEAAALLALESMLQLARSRDICDSRGIAVTEAQVVEHLRQEVHPERWGVIARLGTSAAAATAAERAASDAPAQPPTDVTKAAAPSATTTAGAVADRAVTDRVLAVVGRLRVCSVDRVIREVHRLQPGIGRAAVVSGLEGLGDQVVWLGRNIVAVGGSQAEASQTEGSP